jgi:hypothetical protein
METPNDLLNNAKKIAKYDLNDTVSKSKNAVSGAVIGLIASLMIGYHKGLNLYTSGFLGIISGVIVATLIEQTIKKEKK